MPGKCKEYLRNIYSHVRVALISFTLATDFASHENVHSMKSDARHVSDARSGPLFAVGEACRGAYKFACCPRASIVISVMACLGWNLISCDGKAFINWDYSSPAPGDGEKTLDFAGAICLHKAFRGLIRKSGKQREKNVSTEQYLA